MDDLAAVLVSLAKTLELDGTSVQQASTEALREFTAAVLEELVARGALDDSAELGCWARPRTPLS